MSNKKFTASAVGFFHILTKNLADDIITSLGKFHKSSFSRRTKRGVLSFDKNTRFFVIRLVLPNYEIFLAESLKQVFFERSFGYALFVFSEENYGY